MNNSTHPCPACHGHWHKFAFAVKELLFDGSGECEVTYWSCLDCGLGQKRGHDEQRDYYENSWQFPAREHSDGVAWLKEQLKRIAFKAERAMDVGMGADSPYLSALGIAEREDGRKWFGGKSRVIGDGTCSLVVMCHVMEHVLDLNSFLLDVESHVAPSGLIYIEVPSMELEAHRPDCAPYCEDLSRTHNFHFTRQSLFELAVRRGWIVLSLDCAEVDGLLSNRMLVRTGPCQQSGYDMLDRLLLLEGLQYQKAKMALYGHSPETTALYGASQSYYKLIRHEKPPMCAGSYRLFDLYRAGQSIAGREVEHPSAIPEGFTSVVVTCSMRQSRDACVAWLEQNRPDLKVVLAFPDHV